MKLSTATLLAAGASLASAHFGIEYPAWRFDTLSDESETLGYSQWTYPCAGVPVSGSDPAVNGSRTDWPVGGGSLKLALHHEWAYVFVNLGLGSNATNFNVSLTPQFLNSTGEGTLCLDRLAVPRNANVTDGALATIQVVTLGHTGSALYNCADIRFTQDADPLPDNECRSEGVTSFPVSQQTADDDDSDDNDANDDNNDDQGSDDSNSSDNGGDSSPDSGAADLAAMARSNAVLAAVAGAAVLLMTGGTLL